MATVGILSGRDRAVLELLDRTPATSSLIAKASCTFPCGSFRDARRARERLQSLASFGIVRPFSVARGVGGPENWYKITPEGFRLLHGTEAALPHRSRFEAIAPSRIEHVHTLAEIIVHTIVAAHRNRILITDFYGDGALVLEFGDATQVPDSYFQFACAGMIFNVLFEIDNSTEPLAADRARSLRSKLMAYEQYQDHVLALWKQNPTGNKRPAFRVLFLTKTVERANHILWLAGECAMNRDRRLCYAATQDAYLSSEDALRLPLFNDHDGQWQALVQPQPTAKFLLTPIRLSPPRAAFLSL